MDLWDPLDRFLQRTDELRRFIDISVAFDKSAEMSWVGALREARASAIVCSIAELEVLVSDSLVKVNESINGTGVLVRNLKPSLRALATIKEFTSLANLKDAEKVWQTRLILASLHESNETANLPATPRSQSKQPQAPLDGKTLKPIHFKRIASVYSILPSDFVQASHTLALTKFSGARNDIAHANSPFPAIFSQRNFLVSNIREDLGALDEIAFNFVERFSRYVERCEFLE